MDGKPEAGKNQIREAVNNLRWFHQIDFGNGIVSPGVASISQLQAQAKIYFRDGLKGKSVLDIGCWDGFNAIECCRLGASRVLATDHWVWANIPWASPATIELARTHIASGLEIRDLDILDLTPESVGIFDLVLFCGILYHLRDPLRTLASVAKIVGETLIVETHLDAEKIEQPAMIFYPTDELNGDGSNWWGPNRKCVEAMLRDVGFDTIVFTPHPTIPSRGIFRASRR